MHKPKSKLLALLILTIYFIFIFPTALVCKLFKWDPMRRSYNQKRHTYWEGRHTSAPEKNTTALAEGDGNKDPTNYPFW